MMILYQTFRQTTVYHNCVSSILTHLKKRLQHSCLSIVLLLSCFSLLPMKAQTLFRVMSYNVENLFDLKDDPTTDDNAFLPQGERHWHGKRYQHKLHQLSKVIMAAGEWDTPALIGLCEVENETVLTDLLCRTPLKGLGYRFCITDHSDRRGLRVGLLYQPDRFKLIAQRSFSVRFTRKQHKSTREILYVSGQIITGDTLDLFVCHFPSRYGGEKESEPDRIDAAITLRHLTDSLSQCRHHPLLLVMGDFNDNPTDLSITHHLTGGCLHNLFQPHTQQPYPGTHKYRDSWSLFDQIFCNRTAETTDSFRPVEAGARIFAPDFLLIDDKTWLGKRPFRTYHGFRYEAGFSDHLPVIADFEIQ